MNSGRTICIYRLWKTSFRNVLETRRTVLKTRRTVLKTRRNVLKTRRNVLGNRSRTVLETRCTTEMLARRGTLLVTNSKTVLLETWSKTVLDTRRKINCGILVQGFYWKKGWFTLG